MSMNDRDCFVAILTVPVGDFLGHQNTQKKKVRSKCFLIGVTSIHSRVWYKILVTLHRSVLLQMIKIKTLHEGKDQRKTEMPITLTRSKLICRRIKVVCMLI